jgi:hypothetical protein
MAELLVILLITAAVTAAAKSGRAAVKNFATSAHKATGWRTPRAALHHYSGRLGALAGRGAAAAARGGRRAAARVGRHATAAAGHRWQARQAAGAAGPLIWRTRPPAPDGSAGHGADGADPGSTAATTGGGTAGTAGRPAGDRAAPGTRHTPAPAGAGPGPAAASPGAPAAPAGAGQGKAAAGDGPSPGRLDGNLLREIKRQACELLAADRVGPEEVTAGEDGTVILDRRARYPWAEPHVVLRWSPDPADPSRPHVTWTWPHRPGEQPPAAGPGTPPAPVTPPPPAPPAAPAGAERRRTRMTTRYALNLEPPQTDGEFLESCVQLGDVLKSLAEEIASWADGLGALNLPQSVLNPLHQVSDGITDAAAGATQAAKAFEDEFEDARDVAARGMHFTGQDAA